MRAGLATSVTLHALILGWGLVNLSAPDAFDVDDVEALPIELISIEELTQIQEGAKDAPKDGPASLEPTEPPVSDPDAVNVGNQEKDQSTPETETQKAAEVEEARLPDPVDVPLPRPSPREEPKPVVEETPEPESTPATEIAPVPEPKEEVTPDPVEEAIAAADPEPAPEPVEEFVELPSELPTPEARPEPPKPVETAETSEETAPAQTAKTPERKIEENQQSQSAAQQEETKEKADEVASLLNREQGSGGGSKANNQQASAGGEKTTSGNTLTQSEMDSLRGQIQACWSVPANAQGEDGLKVSVQFQLSQGATIEGKPRVTTSSGNRQLDESAVRAVARCGAKGFQLPADKYDSWRDVVVNFDPSEMFR